MALLTAEDVLKKSFQATKFREGYDQEQVDDFLDEVVTTLRAMSAENEELKGRLAAAERRVAELSRADSGEAGQPSTSSPAVEAGVPSQATRPATENAPAAAEDAGGSGDAVERGDAGRSDAAQQESAAPATAAQVTPVPAAAGPQRASEPESATGMLLLAQKLHDDYVRTGREQGDRIVAEAKAQAERIVHDAEQTSTRTLAHLEQERSVLERKIEELRTFERDYRTRLKGYLENLLGDLDAGGTTAVAPGPGGTSQQALRYDG